MSSVHLVLVIFTVLAVTSQTLALAPSDKQQTAISKLDPAQIQELMTADGSMLLKRSLHDALQQHFDLLQEAEEDILQRIRALKAKRQAISQRKRSHYMCLVNLIACYK